VNRNERRASAAMLKARRIGSNVVLDRSRSFDGKCDYCGKHGELRAVHVQCVADFFHVGKRVAGYPETLMARQKIFFFRLTG
jgi:hypothetical protein